MPRKHDYPGVYAIQCNSAGRKYIGASGRIRQRICEHRSKLNLSKHDNVDMMNDWLTHGRKDFEFIELEKCTLENLREREQYHLDKYKNTYNYGRAHSTMEDKLQRRKDDYQKNRAQILLRKKTAYRKSQIKGRES